MAPIDLEGERKRSLDRSSLALINNEIKGGASAPPDSSHILDSAKGYLGDVNRAVEAPIEMGVKTITGAVLPYLNEVSPKAAEKTAQAVGDFFDWWKESLYKQPGDQKFAGKFLSGVIGAAPYVLSGPAGFPAAVMTSSTSAVEEALNRGMDLQTARMEGLKAGITSTLIMKLPQLGKSLVGTLGKSAAVGGGVTIADKLIEKELLSASGYSDLAKQVEVFNPEDIGLGVGLAMGMNSVAHVQRSKVLNNHLKTYDAAIDEGLHKSDPESFAKWTDHLSEATKGTAQEAYLNKLKKRAFGESEEEVNLDNLPGENPAKSTNVAQEEWLLGKGDVTDLINDFHQAEGDIEPSVSVIEAKKKPGRKSKKATEPSENAIKTLPNGPESAQNGEMGVGMGQKELSLTEDVPVGVTKEVSDVERLNTIKARVAKATDPIEHAKATEELNSFINEMEYKVDRKVERANPEIPHEGLLADIPIKELEQGKLFTFDSPSEISESARPSSSAMDKAYALEYDNGKVNRILIDADTWASDKMISQIREDGKKLKELYPGAKFVVVDSRGESPVEWNPVKEIGQRTLYRIKKEFGATEEVNPKGGAKQKAVKETVKEILKTNTKLIKQIEAVTRQPLGDIVPVEQNKLDRNLEKTIQKNIWFRGTKGDTTIVAKSKEEVVKKLGKEVSIDDKGNREYKDPKIEVGELDESGKFWPESTGVIAESERSTLEDIATAMGLNSQRGSFSNKEIDSAELKAREEAKARLRQKLTAAMAYAESIGKDPIKYLEELGLEQDMIRKMQDSIAADDAKKEGFYTPARMASYLKKALKLSDEQFIELKKSITGIEHMKNMNLKDKKRVIDAMQKLHIEKMGFEYKPKSRTEKKIIQRDIDQAKLQEHLEPKNLWGLKEMTMRLVYAGSDYVERIPAGAELMAKVKRIRTDANLAMGEYMAEYRGLSHELSEGQKKEAVHVWAEGLETKDPKVKEFAELIGKGMQMVGREMDRLGVTVTGIKGDKKVFQFDEAERYFPHDLNWDQIQNPGRRRDIAISHLMKKYPERLKTKAQAERFLDNLMERRRATYKYGHMEYARDFDVPGWNDNPDEVVPSYIYKSLLRLRVIEEFGQDNAKLDEMLMNVKKQGGTDFYETAFAVTKRALGEHTYTSPLVRELVNKAMAFEVFTKLGAFAITNMSQSVNTYGVTDAISMAKGLKKLVDSSTREEALAYAFRSGATAHTFVDEFSGMARGDTLASKFMRGIGGTQTETFNRLFAAVVGREYVREQWEKLSSAEPNSRQSRLARTRLEKLGLSADELIAKGGPDDYDLRMASNNLVEKTQFVSNSLTLPAWTGDSYWLKLITLFHTFAYHQSRFMVKMAKEDPQRILPMLGAMISAGFVTSSVKDVLRNKTQEEDTEWYQDTLKWIGSAGGFGMLSDVMSSIWRGDGGFTKYIGGVVVGDVDKYATAFAKGLSGDFTPLGKAVTRDIPVVGPTIKNSIDWPEPEPE